MTVDDICPSCGLPGTGHGGPPPSHIAASAYCWATYRAVLASEYRDPDRWNVRSLTLDAYSAQHPGGRSRRATEATGAHLIGLCVALERNLDSAQVGSVRAAAADRLGPGIVWLAPPTGPASTTIATIAGASTAEEHHARVRAWATAVWASWQEHHETVRHWIDWLYAASPPTLAR